VAIPLELVNFFIFPFPIDVGLSDNASWFRQVMGFQWVILHWPGLRLLQWLGRIGQMRLGTVALIASGYADTALLLIAAFLAFRGIRRLAQRMAP
jgi:hypothetical protein